MAGIANMLLGAGLAGATWMAPQASEIVDRLPTWVKTSLIDNEAGLAAGAVIAGVGFVQMGLGWMGQVAKAIRRGPRATDEKVIDVLFVRAAAAMAAADGHAAEAEVEMVRAMALRFRGVPVAPSRAKAAIAAAKKDAKPLLHDLRKEAKSMPEHAKEQIVQGALWIAMADLSRDPAESKLMGDFADALALRRERLETIKASMEKAAASLVQAVAVTPAAPDEPDEAEPVVRPSQVSEPG